IPVVAAALWAWPSSAHAQQTADASLRPVSQSPWNGPHRPLDLAFSATNVSSTALSDLSVELTILTPARSRSVYELSLRADATSTLFAYSFPEEGTLGAGQTRTFSIHHAMDDVAGRGETVIYPTRVELRSQDITVGKITVSP